ncbi:MAG: xanthine dehydrogenase molybdopterin binding subunit [Verrucomicrobiota bacterium]
MSDPFVIINGERVAVAEAPVHQSILDFLRQSGRTGSKVGCNEGDCGACTLLLLEKSGPPRAINGCLALVGSLVGREIVTAEGLETPDGRLHPVQEAMVEQNGSQCGYCTPGFVCSMAEAAARGIQKDPGAVADQLCGNLCRCTGYRPIREAMAASASTELAAAESGPSQSLPGYHRPGSLSEVLALKAEHPEFPFIAGATELAVLINKRHDRPAGLISLEDIPELARIQKSQTHWTVGAGLPLTDLESELGEELPALRAMLRRFASRQIRHRATLGGNLVTASPIGDSAPVLLALDAVVTLVSVRGERSLPLADFFLGYRKTELTPDELLLSVTFPRVARDRLEFYKVSKRREMDISAVSAAIRMATDEGGLVTEARLAFGGVAATPARAYQTEAALLGRPFEDAASGEVLEILGQEFSPLDDLRASAEFRCTLLQELLCKFVAGERDRIEVPCESSFEGPPAEVSSHESARGHVTGKALYVEDASLKGGGTLFLHPVRAPVARGTLRRLETQAAQEMTGVRAILSAADVPGLNNTGPARHDEPLFAERDIEFHGQIVAAVVAESPELARLAAEQVGVECKEGEPVLGIEAALAAHSFHTDPHVLERGDVEEALARAPKVLEGTVTLGGQDHFYLETQAASARPDDQGGLWVQSSSQHPSEIQTIVAEVLGKRRHDIVVESPRMGGGFGGKETQGNPWAAMAALGALATGRKVSVQLDRDLDMESTGKRHPFFARYRVGFDATGQLCAAKIELFSDGGWSLDLSLPVNDRGLFHLDNAYYIPHVRFTGRVCKTNVTSHTAFRGFGGPQGMLVIEDIVARVATHLKLPPEKVRARNFYRGSGASNTTHYGEEVAGNRLHRIWRELLESAQWQQRRQRLAAWNTENPYRKRGLAITPVKFGISFTLKHYNQAGALVLLYADGSVQVNHGGTEMGQGLHTKILQVTMRELGLPAERVRLMHTRTDKVPNTSATAASSGSDLNGMAVADACAQLKARLTPLAAERLGGEEASIRFAQGRVWSGKAAMPFEELVGLAYTERIQLSAAGFYATPDLEWDWSVGKGKPFHYYAFGAAVSEVEIDGFTGMQHLRRVDILHDVGDSLSSSIDRGQIEGGFVQGAGWLTSEELAWDPGGRLLSHSASTYAIPAFSDAPLDFRVSLLQDATQDRTIHGSKAVGEPPFMLALSVREALRDALAAFGAETEQLPSPLTPEVIKRAIGSLRPSKLSPKPTDHAYHPIVRNHSR